MKRNPTPTRSGFTDERVLGGQWSQQGFVGPSVGWS